MKAQLPNEGTEEWQSIMASAFAHICVDDTEEWLKSRSGMGTVPLTQKQEDMLRRYLRLLRDPRTNQLLEKEVNPLHRKAGEVVNRLALSDEADEALLGLLVITLCCEAEVYSFVIPPVSYNSALALRSILFWHPLESGNPRENFFMFDCFRGAGRRASELLQQRALEKEGATATRAALNWFCSHKEEYLFQAMKGLTKFTNVEELLRPEELPSPPDYYDKAQNLAGDLFQAILSTEQATGFDGTALLYVSGGLLPYLRTTIRNLPYKKAKRKIEEHEVTGGQETIAEDGSTSTIMDRAELEQALESYKRRIEIEEAAAEIDAYFQLAKLGPIEREVLTLKAEGYEYVKIKEILKPKFGTYNIANLRQIHARALRKLKAAAKIEL